MMTYLVKATASLAVSLAVATVARGDLKTMIVTPMGDAGDALYAVKIQSDGDIVIAGDITDGPLIRGEHPKRQFYRGGGQGLIALLSPNGAQVKAVAHIGPTVRDVVLDAEDNIYAATGEGGLVKLDPEIKDVTWRRTGGWASRVDAGPKRLVAVLAADHPNEEAKPGRGAVAVFDHDGKKVTDFKGRHNTLDVAIDEEGGRVFTIGWRQARAVGQAGEKTNPVQIAYTRATGLDGEVQWTGYDWPTKREDPMFLNKPTNNMADTRGYRITFVAPKVVVAGFEAAGGNHIFRYSPLDVTRRQGVIGGDKYHEFFNSKSEHKTVLVALDSKTGEAKAVQQFTGRLDSGAANAVRLEAGALTVSEEGNILIGGRSAAGLPLDWRPEGDKSDYTGGGFIWMMDDSLRRRLWCGRVQPDAQTHDVAVRRVDRITRLVWVGRAGRKDDVPLPTVNPLQDKQAAGGAFLVLQADRNIPESASD